MDSRAEVSTIEVPAARNRNFEELFAIRFDDQSLNPSDFENRLLGVTFSDGSSTRRYMFPNVSKAHNGGFEIPLESQLGLPDPLEVFFARSTYFRGKQHG